MATYLELETLRTDGDLNLKITTAVMVKAQNLLDKTPPSNGEVAWAKEAISNPRSKAKALINYVLAVNKALTSLQIKTATDAEIQANIDTAVDALIIT